MKTITIVDGIIIKNNKLLLLKKHSKDYYEFPGGKVKKGESITQCLQRELKEEIGIEPTQYKGLKEIYLEFENKKITDHGFLIEEYTGEPKITEEKTFEKIIWISLKDIDTLKTAPNVKQILRQLS